MNHSPSEWFSLYKKIPVQLDGDFSLSGSGFFRLLVIDDQTTFPGLHSQLGPVAEKQQCERDPDDLRKGIALDTK